MASDKKKFDLQRYKTEWDRGFAQTSSRIPTTPPPEGANFSGFEESAARAASSFSAGKAAKPAQRPEATSAFGQARPTPSETPTRPTRGSSPASPQEGVKPRREPAPHSETPAERQPTAGQRTAAEETPTPKAAEPESAKAKAGDRPPSREAGPKRKPGKAAAAPTTATAAAWGELRAGNAEEDKVAAAAAETSETQEPTLPEPDADGSQPPPLGPALSEPRAPRLVANPGHTASDSHPIDAAARWEPHLGKPGREEPYLHRPQPPRREDTAVAYSDDAEKTAHEPRLAEEAPLDAGHRGDETALRAPSSGTRIETAAPIDGGAIPYDEDEGSKEEVYLTVPSRPLRTALRAPLSRPLLSAVVLLCAVSAATAAFVLRGPETDAVSGLSTALRQQPEASRETQQPSSETPESASPTEVQEVEETSPPPPPEPAPEPEVATAQPGETGGMILPESRPASLSAPPASDKPGSEPEAEVAAAEQETAAEREPASEGEQESAGAPESSDESESTAAAASESDSEPESEAKPVEAVRGVPTPEQVAALVGRTITGGAESYAASTSNNLVATVQRALMWRGYDPGPVDGVEGAKTRAAVRAFQRQLGVEANGEIDLVLLQQLRSVETAPGAEELGSAQPGQPQETSESQLASTAASSPSSAAEPAAEPVQLNAALQSDPQQQQRDPVVAEVQRALRLHGYDPGPINGIAGSQTQSAARAFQRRAGLEVDGEIDAELLQSLNRADAPALRESAARAQNPESSESSESSSGLTRRMEKAVDSVAELLGLQRGGEVDPDFARPTGESDTR